MMGSSNCQDCLFIPRLGLASSNTAGTPAGAPTEPFPVDTVESGMRHAAVFRWLSPRMSHASSKLSQCRGAQNTCCGAHQKTAGPASGRQRTLGSAGLGRSAELPSAPAGRAAPFATAAAPLASIGEVAGEVRPAPSCCSGTYWALGCWYRAVMTRQTLTSSARVTSNSSHHGGSSGRDTCRTAATVGEGAVLCSTCLVRPRGDCGGAEQHCLQS